MEGREEVSVEEILEAEEMLEEVEKDGERERREK